MQKYPTMGKSRPRLGVDFGAWTANVEFQDWLVEIELHTRAEAVDCNALVMLPEFKGMEASLGDDGVGFYASSTGVIARDE